MYLPSSPSAAPAASQSSSSSRPIVGSQRSRSHIQEAGKSSVASVTGSLGSSVPNSATEPVNIDTSSPLSSSSISSSPQDSFNWSPSSSSATTGKPRRLSRASTTSNIVKRRSSEVREKEIAPVSITVPQRHSSSVLDVEHLLDSPTSDDSIRQHLRELQRQKTPSNTHRRSDSLSRLRDSASSLLTPAITDALQRPTPPYSSGGSSPTAAPLDRISASFKNSTLRLPESVSGSASPSGNGSSDPSPTVSPGGSPRSRIPRVLQKALDALEGGDCVFFFFCVFFFLKKKKYIYIRFWWN